MSNPISEHITISGHGSLPFHARLNVYEDETFLGKRFFADGCLSIGRSRKADILLNHPSVQDIHAVVRIDGQRLILKNNYPENGLRVNGLSVESVPLKSQDVIKIGPFDLLVEIDAFKVDAAGLDTVSPLPVSLVRKDESTVAEKGCNAPANQSCTLMLVDQYHSEAARLEAAGKLAAILKKNPKICLSMLSRKRLVLKGGLDQTTATRWRKKLQAANIFCLVKKEEAEPAPTPQCPQDPLLHDIIPDDANLLDQTPVTAKEISPAQLPQYQFNSDEEDDEDDEEDALWSAPFSMKDKLDASAHVAEVSRLIPRQLAITKAIDHTIIDVANVANGQKYTIPFEKGTRPFVRCTAKGMGQVFFTRSMAGYIKYANQTTVDLDQYKLDNNLFSRWRQRYRLTVPDDAIVVIVDGDITHTIGYVRLAPWSDLKEPLLSKVINWRHWATSFGFHMALFLVAGLVYLFQAAPPIKEQPHFVKIDSSMLNQMELKKIEKPKPKKKAPIPKAEPQKVVKMAKPINKPVKSTKIRKAATPKKTNKKIAKAAPPSKHPNAGGGYGKGNIKNRDINQAGLLSMLGNSNIAGPSEAIASITNLDAVPSPGVTEKNYTVGGIKGTLGSGKIVVSNDTIVQTKGSTQVMRSAGASGPGRVAALEKGKTGKNQVQAMVTAKMTGKVKIQGGMSRDAVKRVIDQHLDDITMCYETALLSNPSISGRVVFEWKILMSGRVGEIKIVSSNINSHDIHTCIKNALKSWQFPKPKGAEVMVSYPFVFDLVAF